MKLSEFFDYDFPTQNLPPKYQNGIIYRMCRMNFGGSTVRNDELKPIFYPFSDTWRTYPLPQTNDAYNIENPFDFDYYLRSGDKEIFSKFEKYKWLGSGQTNIGLPDVDYPTEYPLYAFLQEKKATWLKLYADLMEPYQPFSNYYLNEEMVRNEKTGSSHSENASSGTSENWSTGSEENNEDYSSKTSDTGSVTQKVKGYNSTDFVDSSQSIPDTDTDVEGDSTTTRESTDHDAGSTSASGERDAEYSEEKSYLLRYTGALDVDFQEWIEKEIDMRRRCFIQEVIYADIDKYFCRGVY